MAIVRRTIINAYYLIVLMRKILVFQAANTPLQVIFYFKYGNYYRKTLHDIKQLACINSFNTASEKDFREREEE
jgi:hypothetical protein